MFYGTGNILFAFNFTFCPCAVLDHWNFLNGCPLNAGNPTPIFDLRISLGKTRNVSTNLFMLRELLSDDSKLHSEKHVD